MRLKLLMVCMAGMLGAPSAQAALLVYEGFNYTNNQQLAGQNGGQGFTTSWSSLDGQANGVTIATPSLNPVGGLQTSGLSLRINGRTDPESYRDFSSTFGTAGTTRWISLLLRKNADGPFDDTDFAVVYIGNLKFGVASNGKYSIEDLNGSAAANSSITAQAGPDETVALVASISFTAGNDTVNLYLAEQGGPMPVSPIATKSFQVGTSNTLGLLFGYEADWSFDEFRMGTTLADVTPTPEPAPLSLILAAGAGLLRRRKRA